MTCKSPLFSRGIKSQIRSCAGYYLCNEDVRIGRPRDKAALADLVAHYDEVKGVGVGHSWWGQQFCSGNSSQSINIVTTELQATLDL